MHPFQDNIQTWLSRRQPSYARNRSFEPPFILSSNIGLTRKENQDRTAALFTGRRSTNPLFVMAVADGMGGMRDGGRCSTLTLSSFFYSLIQHRNLGIAERAYEAIKASNNQVFDIYRGDGGSTLTAILIDSLGNKIIVHLGDTRIYTFGHGKSVERHTTDDSLVEAVGGSGRELLQFVGMGESMQPTISELPYSEGFCAITTDGIHGIEEKTLCKILENVNSITEASERLNSVSMWCGGSDNATSAIFDMTEMLSSLAQYEGNGIRLWDADGDLTTLWLREEDQAFNPNIVKIPNQENKTGDYSLVPSPPRSQTQTESKPKKPSPRPRRSKKKKDDDYAGKIQLNIEIGNSDE